MNPRYIPVCPHNIIYYIYCCISDAGIHDRVFIMELLKEVAQSHSIDTSHREFKGNPFIQPFVHLPNYLCFHLSSIHPFYSGCSNRGRHVNKGCTTCSKKNNGEIHIIMWTYFTYFKLIVVMLSRNLLMLYGSVLSWNC